jgi:hypothetical protein
VLSRRGRARAGNMPVAIARKAVMAKVLALLMVLIAFVGALF